MSVSIVIPACNENPWELAATAGNLFRAGANEIVIVDDASDKPVRDNRFLSSCKIVTNKDRIGPGPCRNAGMRAASGDIVIFSDSHMRVESVDRLATLARDNRAVLSASISPLNPKRNTVWTYYGARLVKADKHCESCYELKYNTSKPPAWPHDETLCEVTCLVGAFYAVSRDTMEAIGGWPPTAGWGYNEQGFSLAAHFAGVPLLVDTQTAALHMYRNTNERRYSARATSVYANRLRVHRALFSDATYRGYWEPNAKAWSEQYSKAGRQWANSQDATDMRRHYESRRRRTDLEVARHIEDAHLIAWLENNNG